MKSTFKNYLRMTAILLASGITTAAFAQNPMVPCPNLTVNDVQSIIDNGTISTDQGYTLTDEAGISRAQVLINEPTANPFDTYYLIVGKKNVDNKDYWIYVASILGKASYEAKDRAKKILLSDEKVFSGKYDPERKICMYKEIKASTSISNYPFKSSYETAVLIAVPYEEAPSLMRQMMMKKHRA